MSFVILINHKCTILSKSYWLSILNGDDPKCNSNAITPNAHKSTFSSYLSPLSSSGGKYNGVPQKVLLNSAFL
jgi:hypothetical protein